MKMREATLERLKKYQDYPFTCNTDHYYSLILAQNTLDVWRRISEIVQKYKRDRMSPMVEHRSEEFEKIIKFERNQSPGLITQKTQFEMLKYMKQLEWKNDELETKHIKTLD
jgi:hypothetical protein